MMQLPTPTDGHGEWTHYACPTCGRVFTLPLCANPPWCIHGGSDGYAWPETHWQGGVERHPTWREDWLEAGRTETIRCTVTIEPIVDDPPACETCKDSGTPGKIIVNPDWPKGDGPHLDHCPDCT